MSMVEMCKCRNVGRFCGAVSAGVHKLTFADHGSA